MTKRDGAVGRNEVFGRANKDRLLVKDVVRALGPIFRTSRFLQLPYLFICTYHFSVHTSTGYGYPGTVSGYLET